ncbi:uncharacterized protein VP01_662g7 [Puccinia sorghi]|uniref:HAT C-terminal dimerisation domain-containing protein n=1 Tax=Puccinia sorghi TaxID=27349 RepID=A0A0L6UF20_9BASI|nr:uncharacterized protein VP01_662g7 [Puccinia sorghi]
MAKYLKKEKIMPKRIDCQEGRYKQHHKRAVKRILRKDFEGDRIYQLFLFLKSKKKVYLNNEMLKTAIAYFIAEGDLPFSVVKQKSFHNFVSLLNKQAKVKINLLEKQQLISFTQDAWTAKNVTAFMAMTSHFINDNYKMVDLTIAIPHVQVMLLFRIHSKKVYNTTCVTHFTQLQQMLRWPVSLKASYPLSNQEKLLVCIAHMINLVAKAGLVVIGSLEDEASHTLSMTEMDHKNSAMSI